VSRATRLAADLANQLLYTSEARLVRALLTLADYDEDDPTRCPLPDVTQEFIARMVGTTRSRVNMFLGRFKKLGFIEVQGGVLQINPALLPDVSDDGLLELDAR
jgi:CRP-like cAMP-binding protein